MAADLRSVQSVLEQIPIERRALLPRDLPPRDRVGELARADKVEREDVPVKVVVVRSLRQVGGEDKGRVREVAERVE